jgi:hypothetical protein
MLCCFDGVEPQCSASATPVPRRSGVEVANSARQKGGLQVFAVDTDPICSPSGEPKDPGPVAVGKISRPIPAIAAAFLLSFRILVIPLEATEGIAPNATPSWCSDRSVAVGDKARIHWWSSQARAFVGGDVGARVVGGVPVVHPGRQEFVGRVVARGLGLRQVPDHRSEIVTGHVAQHRRARRPGNRQASGCKAPMVRRSSSGSCGLREARVLRIRPEQACRSWPRD